YHRDSVYHQGTVWPWLIGPFLSAYLRLHESSLAASRRANEILAGFEDHLAEAGLGQVSEILDADVPHTPRGCIAQAWSVSELLRIAVEIAQLQKKASLPARTPPRQTHVTSN
ncbi:MAG TPA: amylo-alpha-1,6-glucosidase, partial [Terriglobales bacterium]|nr:amylo-alpha-1,6-glucosidase [Terriglobales bacterium]